MKKDLNKKSQSSIPHLMVPIEDAERKLDARIELSDKIKLTTIGSEDELDKAKKEFYKWDAFNKDLLRALFDSEELSEEYSRPLHTIFMGGATSLGEDYNEFLEDIQDKRELLESIKGRLPLFVEIEAQPIQLAPNIVTDTNSIFIVHGRVAESKEQIARFLTQLGLSPIVLHEKPSGGMTVSEKLSHYSDVGFAIVILTPDDVGCLDGEQTKGGLKKRARQNVIFELGYFLGKLGKQRVCALYVGDVELPSDYAGVIYIPMDAHDGWKMKLARELRESGLKVDLNRIM